MIVRLVCEKCGRDFKADGYHTKHRSGNVSFTVFSVNEKENCVYCEHPELFEKEAIA